MTDESATFGADPQDGTPIVDAIEDGGEVEVSPSGMREKLAEQAARITELEQEADERDGIHRATTMQHEFDRLGLDTHKGIGLAAAQTYDGPPEGLAEYVEEQYNHFGPPHPMSEAIADGQARLDMIGQTAGSVAAPTQHDVLAKAEATGDYATTMAIKGEQVARMFRP